MAAGPGPQSGPPWIGTNRSGVHAITWPRSPGRCAGDRYLLKLFHDWLFHPTGGASESPVLDWGRVVESLNKLDAGVPEQVSLMSRDEASLLVRPS